MCVCVIPPPRERRNSFHLVLPGVAEQGSDFYWPPSQHSVLRFPKLHTNWTHEVSWVREQKKKEYRNGIKRNDRRVIRTPYASINQSQNAEAELWV